jgi:hypothetical protein
MILDKGAKNTLEKRQLLHQMGHQKLDTQMEINEILSLSLTLYENQLKSHHRP